MADAAIQVKRGMGIEIWQPVIPDTLLRALKEQADHLTYTGPTTIYYCVEPDYRDVLVGVFGDGANGMYEWFIWGANASTLRTSDCGCPGVALCCGLVEAKAKRTNGKHNLVLTWMPAGKTNG